MVKLSCVIPAYNEEARIGDVLRVAMEVDAIDEIIVVDDCSTDKTASIVEGVKGVTLLRHGSNQGKTQAVKNAVNAAKGEYLLMIDADLMGLTSKALETLIEPVLNEKADISISLRKNAPPAWQALGIDYISGERVCRRSFLSDHLSVFDELPKFGLEVYMNDEILAQDMRIAVIPWHDVISPMKVEKFGFWAGIKRDLLMLKDMLNVISPFHMVRQVIAMRRARVMS